MEQRLERSILPLSIFYHLSPKKNPVPTGWLSGGITTRS
nr:MAG TPA: hypothetical protein [Caudoviricetes sp.]